MGPVILRMWVSCGCLWAAKSWRQSHRGCSDTCEEGVGCTGDRIELQNRELYDEGIANRTKPGSKQREEVMRGHVGLCTKDNLFTWASWIEA